MIATPCSAQSVKAGIEAWQQGDHARAVAIWRPLAENGNADASFNLGQAYRLGRGVDINLGAAQLWLERAARKDHLDAQATLGLLLFESGNRQGGLRWLRMAAEGGEPRALLVYGTALFNGEGLPRDPVLGYAYVSRSAAQGLAPAKETLGEMDRMLPLDQRRKGVALAMEKAKQPESSKASQQVKAQATPPSTTAKKQPSPSNAPKAIADGGWRIQLGAFSKPSSAEALYKRLAGSPPVAGLKQYLVPAGGVTRLQVGPFESRAAANAACQALSGKGQACFSVAAK